MTLEEFFNRFNPHIEKLALKAKSRAQHHNRTVQKWFRVHKGEKLKIKAPKNDES